MIRKNVLHLLNEIDDLKDEYNEIHLEEAMYTPSYLIPLVSYLYQYSIEYNKFGVHQRNKNYFITIGLYRQLWEHHDQWNRANCGNTYSPIVRLNSIEHVDQATTEICNCINNMVSGSKSRGIGSLYSVIGELHDNVWSHGKSTGFSMAQSYKEFANDKRYLEFTLADKGFGLLGEMKRAGEDINDHQLAIEWCIQEGNSTKHERDEDPWKQRLPSDLIGDDPMGGFGGEISDNHHQGLGLAHLIKLVENFNGELYLVSGNMALHIKNNQRKYLRCNHDWKGVIISCRFDQHELISSVRPNNIADQNVNDIIKRLRGD